jgi:hypothetical protein
VNDALLLLHITKCLLLKDFFPRWPCPGWGFAGTLQAGKQQAGTLSAKINRFAPEGNKTTLAAMANHRQGGFRVNYVWSYFDASRAHTIVS